jgi:hypothetical protein
VTSIAVVTRTNVVVQMLGEAQSTFTVFAEASAVQLRATANARDGAPTAGTITAANIINR